MRIFLAVVRRNIVVFIAVGIFAVGTNMAYAHFVYEKAITYYSTSAPCVENYAEISHGDGYGYAKANVKSWRKINWAPLECIWKFDRPQYYIKVKYQLHYHDGDSWSLCQNSSYKYNTTVARALTKSKTFSSSEYCGPGDYGVWNYGYVRNGDNWYGGSIWSGTHTLN